jgi:hypothetical protein
MKRKVKTVTFDSYQKADKFRKFQYGDYTYESCISHKYELKKVNPTQRVKQAGTALNAFRVHAIFIHDSKDYVTVSLL